MAVRASSRPWANRLPSWPQPHRPTHAHGRSRSHLGCRTFALTLITGVGLKSFNLKTAEPIIPTSFHMMFSEDHLQSIEGHRQTIKIPTFLLSKLLVW